jgi:hypothetical protein
LMTQELGILALIQRAVRVLTANGDDLTDSSDPSRKMMRQIAGSFAEYEKARLVAKLRGARERKRRENGKCEGRSTCGGEPRAGRPGPSAPPASPEGWPAVVTGDFSRACGARVQERARECVLRGFDFLDACLTAEVR